MLALAQRHPDLVSTVIAHEPPLEQLLEDSGEQLARAEDLIATYLAGDRIGAWKKFFAQANIFMPEGAVEQWFGGEQEPQAAADERFWFEHELRASVSWQPDFDALRGSGVRIVVGIGEESGDQLCERTSTALAAALGVEPDRFPGDHTGFVDQPEPFATRLRAVLDQG